MQVQSAFDRLDRSQQLDGFKLVTRKGTNFQTRSASDLCRKLCNADTAGMVPRLHDDIHSMGCQKHETDRTLLIAVALTSNPQPKLGENP